MHAAIFRIVIWLLLSLTALALDGCATMSLMGNLSETQAGPDLPGNENSRLVLTDEIVAIGRPDAKLARRLDNDHVVAFIGLKNTYLLYQGGQELQRVASLNLDWKRLTVDSATYHSLHLKDSQVWGRLILTYGADGSAISAAERETLEHAGFYVIESDAGPAYQRWVIVYGVTYPAIQLSSEQLSKLAVHQSISFFDAEHATPPARPSALTKGVMYTFSAAIDVALAPVYLGLGVVTLAILPYSTHVREPDNAPATSTTR